MSDQAAPNPHNVELDAVSPTPSPAPRQEIEDLLANSEGRLGDVYRLTVEGLTPEQIAERLNVATINFVYSYRYYAEAALDGKPTAGSTLRRQAVSALNALIKRGRNDLSPAALQLLQANRAAVEGSGVDVDPAAEAQADVQEAASAATSLAELEGVPGIYAFSYGWYLESPIDTERTNTLIKIGQAGNVASRIRQHTAGARAHMPEPLALIRVYSTEGRDLVATERMFHELLENARHSNPRRTGPGRREVGKEWFLTNEDFLDSIAKALGLRTLLSGWSEFGPE